MGVPRYIRLLLRPPALNLEEAAWELVHTITSPRKMYKSLYFRQQTRQKWAREDPSFIIFFFVLLCLSAVLWGLTYSPTWSGVVTLFWYMVFVEFVGVGLVVSTALYVLFNKFGQRPGPHTPLEWAFCFDVHCNAFVCIYVWIYFIGYILSPMTLHQHHILAKFVGNSLYLGAASHYCFITFLGYSTLPFLRNTEVLLTPIALAALVYLICMISGVNFAQYMAEEYLNWYRSR